MEERFVTQNDADWYCVLTILATVGLIGLFIVAMMRTGVI